ncbi:hypothetical protein ES703_57166 [subsurface metagenome]
MLVCDWCHSTSDVLQGIGFEMAPIRDEKEAILISHDLCQQCRQEAAEAIRESLLELKKEKKAARIPIPEN